MIIKTLEYNKYIKYIKYIKYKQKYLLLKNSQLNSQSGTQSVNGQIGGGYLTGIDEITNFYRDIEQSGIFDKNVDQFKIFCKFLISKTINNEEVIQSKRKRFLEFKKLTDSKEYKELLNKSKELGVKYKEIGEKFEELVFDSLFDLIKGDIKITKSNTKILKNPILYFSNDGKKWELLGEIDAVIIKTDNDIKYIMGICEFKHSFDDIPDALYQIKRSYDAINSGKLIKLDDEILDDGYKFTEHKSYLDIGFIITSSVNLNNQYFNIGSKLKHYLINALHNYGKLNYEKIFKKITKKQIYNDKLNNKEILRYNSDVLKTIKLLKNENLLNRLKIINSN